MPVVSSPEVSIIIVNWNTRALLAACLQSIMESISSLAALEVEVEIIVVDNASSDDSCQMVKTEFPQVRLLQNQENLGFARANNQAARISQGKYLLLLNSDAALVPGSLQALLSLIRADPHIGLVGARLLNPDGSFQASYTNFPTLWQEFLILSGLGRAFTAPWYPSHGPEQSRGPQKVDYVEGACLLVLRQLYLQLDGLDENYFMYAEEVDLCYRIHHAGWQVWYQPNAPILHHGGGSNPKRSTRREGNLYLGRVRFFRQHYGPFRANLLKALIFLFTALKTVPHGVLRAITAGRKGRPVISLAELAHLFRQV